MVDTVLARRMQELDLIRLVDAIAIAFWYVVREVRSSTTDGDVWRDRQC